MRSLVAVLSSALLIAAVPAAAHASCAATPLADVLQQTPVVVTAQAQPGATSLGVGGPLISPATFKVRSWDKGSGAGSLKVTTGSLGGGQNNSEGIFPLPGQVWRLYGSLDASGTLATSICSGSLAIVSHPAPAIIGGGATTTLKASTVAGAPHAGKLPSAKITRPATLRVPVTRDVPVAQDVAVLLVKGGTSKVLKLTFVPVPGEKVLTARLAPAAVKRGATLVVVTRSASFAATLR